VLNDFLMTDVDFFLEEQPLLDDHDLLDVGPLSRPLYRAGAERSSRAVQTLQVGS